MLGRSRCDGALQIPVAGVGNGEAVHEFEGLILGDLDRVVASVRERAITGGAVSVTADVRAHYSSGCGGCPAGAHDASRRGRGPPGVEACTSTRAATCLAAVKAFRDGFLDVLDSSAMSPEALLPHMRTVDALFDRLELETLAIAERLGDGDAGAPVLKDANMLAALPMPAFIIARDGTMLFHNDAALLVVDDSNGRRSDGNFKFPEPVRRELAAFRVSGATGHTAESELSTGRGLRYFQMRFSPVDVAGERESALVILSDLTHRRRAEEALRRSQAKYQSVFEHMATGFALMRVVLDRRNRPMDYVIIEVNRALESMFSLQAGQLIGLGERSHRACGRHRHRLACDARAGRTHGPVQRGGRVRGLGREMDIGLGLQSDPRTHRAHAVRHRCGQGRSSGHGRRRGVTGPFCRS